MKKKSIVEISTEDLIDRAIADPAKVSAGQVRRLGLYMKAQAQKIQTSIQIPPNQLGLFPHDHGAGVEVVKAEGSKLRSIRLAPRDLKALKELLA